MANDYDCSKCDITDNCNVDCYWVNWNGVCTIDNKPCTFSSFEECKNANGG